MKAMADICKLAGVKYAEAQFGGQVFLTDREPSGIWIKDGSTAVALEPYLGDMQPDYAKKVQRYAEGHRDAEKRKKEAAKAKAELQKKAQEDAQKRSDDQLRSRIKQANPSATEQQIETILPKVREAEMIKRTLQLGGGVNNSQRRKF